MKCLFVGGPNHGLSMEVAEPPPLIVLAPIMPDMMVSMLDSSPLLISDLNIRIVEYRRYTVDGFIVEYRRHTVDGLIVYVSQGERL